MFSSWYERRAPQHVLAVADPEEVRQVGVTAAELADRQGAPGRRQVRAQPRLKPQQVQLLVGPDVNQFRSARGTVGHSL